MIDNVYGHNDKTPPPPGSQHVMLHTKYIIPGPYVEFLERWYFKKILFYFKK